MQKTLFVAISPYTVVVGMKIKVLRLPLVHLRVHRNHELHLTWAYLREGCAFNHDPHKLNSSYQSDRLGSLTSNPRWPSSS
ncbi:uncharacterized protein P174DRAFT_441165, partial [Aspergillus novofumigatus IBT 16806]